MAKTEPIRKIQDIEKLKNYLKKSNRSRDYLLFTLGVNTALRISDILSLKYNDVIDFESRKVKGHVNLKEQKTGKDKCCFLNEVCVRAINEYHRETNGSKDDYLFPRAMSQAAALARIFGECREGQIPRPLGRKEQARPCPVACCGVFDSKAEKVRISR